MTLDPEVVGDNAASGDLIINPTGSASPAASSPPSPESNGCCHGLSGI